jgi:hypothetical protein
MCMGENGMYDDNVEIIATNEIYEMSVSFILCPRPNHSTTHCCNCSSCDWIFEEKERLIIYASAGIGGLPFAENKFPVFIEWTFAKIMV